MGRAATCLNTLVILIFLEYNGVAIAKFVTTSQRADIDELIECDSEVRSVYVQSDSERCDPHFD